MNQEFQNKLLESELSDDCSRTVFVRLHDPFGQLLFHSSFVDPPGGIATQMFIRGQLSMKIPFSVEVDSPVQFYWVLTLPET